MEDPRKSVMLVDCPPTGYGAPTGVRRPPPEYGDPPLPRSMATSLDYGDPPNKGFRLNNGCRAVSACLDNVPQYKFHFCNCSSCGISAMGETRYGHTRWTEYLVN